MTSFYTFIKETIISEKKDKELAGRIRDPPEQKY